MPLQIRRGTDAERTAMTQPLAAGELIFVSNTNRLFIGNGTTLGGVPVTDYTDEQARDAVAPMLVAGTHNAISFVYDDALDKVNATVDLSDYQGVIKAAAFNGSVVANDSSLLIDGNTGKFNLSGSVGTDIIPDTDIVYDLGSPTFRFRDLYLSGSSIKLGGATITSTGTAVNLPAGSTIGGSEIGMPGGDLNVNIVADDSTVIVNTTTEVVTAQGGFVGNVTGNVTGDVRGSVFGDDSSVIVNAIDRIVTAAGGFVGNVTGNTAGVHTGNVTGNITGVVTGTAGSSLVGNVTGNITGVVTGTAGSSLVGNVTGNVTGNINGVVTGTAGSSLVGNITGNVTGNTTGVHTGNVTGSVTGDVRGSIFGDDSTLLVDGVSNILSNGIIRLSADSITSLTGQLIIGDPAALTGTELTFNQTDSNSSLNIKNVTGALNAVSKVSFTGYKTSLTSPGIPTAGELVGALSFNAYNPAISNKIPLGLVSAKIDPLGSYNASFADGKLEFITGSIAGGGTLRYFTFDSLGQMAVNQQTALATLDVAGTIRTSGYTVATLPAGVIGMLAYVTDALGPTYLGTLTGGGAVKVPVFYNGAAWVSH